MAIYTQGENMSQKLPNDPPTGSRPPAPPAPPRPRLCEIPTDELAARFVQQMIAHRGSLEWARKFVAALVHGLRLEFAAVIQEQDALVAAAVKAERDACARVCERRGESLVDGKAVANQCAADVRARGTP